MRAIHRWLLALSAAILVAGAVGVVTHSGTHRGATRTPPTTRPVGREPTTTVTRRTTPTTAGPPGPNSTTLAANMVTPTDLGGFYRVRLDTAASILNSAPCLAGLQPAPAQSGQAATGLVGPNYLGVPTIVEVVASYPGTRASSVYRAVAATVRTCSSFPVQLNGATVRVPITPSNISVAADALAVYQGQFTIYGRSEILRLAVVLHSQLVFGIIYVDSVPGSDPLYADFPSFVTTAIGKQA